MITGFDGQTEEYILDGEEMAAYEAVVSAARGLLAQWEKGNLSEAVQALAEAVRSLDEDEEEEEEDGVGLCVKCGTQCVADGSLAVLCPNPDCVQHEDDCDCADRSWYGDDHDSACPVTLRRNEAKAKEQGR